MSCAVSVVLPVYNEEATLEFAVSEAVAALESFLPGDAFEVIIAEDGSEDRTPEIADRLARTDERIGYFHSDERLGRGRAVEAAFRASAGDVLVYFDSDLATDMTHLQELIESVLEDGYDVVTGSRWLRGRKAERSLKRGVASRAFNRLVRLMLASDLRDHQCGFKAFRREAAFELFDAVDDTHWFWDTEVLVRAQRMGYRVKEFPVEWTEKGDTKVDFFRDVLDMGGGIARLWWEYSVDPRITPGTTAAGGMLSALLLILLGVQFFDPSEIAAHIAAADSLLAALAALLYVVSFPVMAVRYRTILTELGFRERLGFLTGAIFVSQTGNVVLPVRAGDPMRAYLLKVRCSVPYPSGFASLAIERIFDLLMVTALAGAVLVGFGVTGVASTDDLYANIVASDSGMGGTVLLSAAVVGLAALTAVGLIVVSVQTDRNYVHLLGDRLGSSASATRLVGIADRFIGDLQRVAVNPRTSFRIAASSFAIWSIDVLVAVIVLLAFGVSISPVTLLAVGFFAVSVGNLAKILPLSSGGIGVYEGAFTVLIVGLTPISASTALSAAIVDHAIKNGVTVLGGVGSMLALNISFTAAVERGRDAIDTTADTK
ncbi:flippase-like domain-containing protein (plasmid) [Haloferacaceae archaeon DSL9]